MQGYYRRKCNKLSQTCQYKIKSDLNLDYTSPNGVTHPSHMRALSIYHAQSASPTV